MLLPLLSPSRKADTPPPPPPTPPPPPPPPPRPTDRAPPPPPRPPPPPLPPPHPRPPPPHQRPGLPHRPRRRKHVRKRPHRHPGTPRPRHRPGPARPPAHHRHRPALLLGTIPDSPRFRHHADNPLPFDVVVVDEASMIDLPLMAKLVEAVPDGARLVLLGDPDQLPSVEAGDRKRAVKGTHVSVREDSGGRRTSKKKTPTNIKH